MRRYQFRWNRSPRVHLGVRYYSGILPRCGQYGLTLTTRLHRKVTCERCQRYLP